MSTPPTKRSSRQSLTLGVEEKLLVLADADRARCTLHPLLSAKFSWCTGRQALGAAGVCAASRASAARPTPRSTFRRAHAQYAVVFKFRSLHDEVATQFLTKEFMMETISPRKQIMCVSALDKSRLESMIERRFDGEHTLTPPAKTLLRKLRSANWLCLRKMYRVIS